MLERIVLVSLVPEHATAEGRTAVAAYARAALGALPGVVEVRTGLALDAPSTEPAANSWDVSFIIRLRSADDYPAYRDHPDHRAFLDDYLAPRSAFKKAWNFEVCEGK